jgi:hypothetical protein
VNRDGGLSASSFLELRHHGKKEKHLFLCFVSSGGAWWLERLRVALLAKMHFAQSFHVRGAGGGWHFPLTFVVPSIMSKQASALLYPILSHHFISYHTYHSRYPAWFVIFILSQGVQQLKAQALTFEKSNGIDVLAPLAQELFEVCFFFESCSLRSTSCDLVFFSKLNQVNSQHQTVGVVVEISGRGGGEGRAGPARNVS